MVEGARLVDFNHTDTIADCKDTACITAVTVYTSAVSLDDGEPVEMVVDVVFEYTVGGTRRQTGLAEPEGVQSSAVHSSTFGLPGGQRITEVVCAFSPVGLTFISFRTNRRLHMFGKAMPASKGGYRRELKIPAGKVLIGLKGQRAPAGLHGMLVIQALEAEFAELPYLAAARVSSVTMDRPVRKIKRVSGRSADTSLVSSAGSHQSAGSFGEPRTNLSGKPGDDQDGDKRNRRGFVTVVRAWKHPLGGEVEGEFAGDAVNGRATFTWHNGDRYVGQVQGGVAHGWGVLTIAKSGDTYNGSFENGDLRGWGTMRFGNGDLRPAIPWHACSGEMHARARAHTHTYAHKGTHEYISMYLERCIYRRPVRGGI